jgi:hypothetical protein
MASFMLPAALPPGKEPRYPLDRRVWAPEPVERIKTLVVSELELHLLGHPLCSQLLYLLLSVRF